MSASPPVSVIMSVYNGEKYLAEAMDSILRQSFADFEFVIVNDGSSDQSEAILRDYERRDPRVRIISRPNTGLIRALNELVETSRGKYLARMDHDDIAKPERLRVQFEYLEAHPECVCVGSRVMLMDPYGSPVAETGHKLTHEEIDHELMTRSGWAMVHPAVMMRRDAVIQIGLYRPQWKHCEDHDLFLRLAEVGRVANLPEVLLWYRRHYESINFTRREEQAKLKLELLKEAHDRRGVPMPADFKTEYWTPPARQEQSRLWGWAALKAGNVRVARKHAMAALRQAPVSMASWKLMYCALRGR